MIIQEDKKNSDLVWQALNMRLFLLWKELLLMQWLPLIFPIPLFYLEKFSKAQASGNLPLAQPVYWQGRELTSGVARVLCRHSSFSEKTKERLFLFKWKTLHLFLLVVEFCASSMGYALSHVIVYKWHSCPRQYWLTGNGKMLCFPAACSLQLALDASQLIRTIPLWSLNPKLCSPRPVIQQKHLKN